jgi:hypothetical protein
VIGPEVRVKARSCCAGLETGLIQEREHVEFSEPVDILDEVLMELTHPDQIAIAVAHENVVLVPVWMSRGHDGDAEVPHYTLDFPERQPAWVIHRDIDEAVDVEACFRQTKPAGLLITVTDL